MSKRFGRNQRRELREKNAALNQQVVEAMDLRRKAERAASTLEDLIVGWDRMVEKDLGPDSRYRMFINKREANPNMRGGSQMRWAKSSPLPNLSAMNSISLAHAIERIHMNLAYFRRYADDYTGDIRFIVSFGDEQVGYAASARTMDEASYDPNFAQWVTNAIIKEMQSSK